MNFIIKGQHAPDGVIIKYGDTVSGKKPVMAIRIYNSRLTIPREYIDRIF